MCQISSTIIIDLLLISFVYFFFRQDFFSQYLVAFTPLVGEVWNSNRSVEMRLTSTSSDIAN